MRTGVDNFQSEKLVLSREARGMTQASLAELSGISAPTLSKWESGAQVPGYSNLVKVAEALKFPINWFMDHANINADCPYFYRSLKRETKSFQYIAKAKLQITNAIVNKLEEWIEFPALDLPNLNIPDFQSLTTSEIENIAYQCREYWKLGIAPIPNMIELLESIGVIVIRDYLGSADMDGVSTWINEKPFIFISADKDNFFRNRFDAAHELGHIILHRNIPNHYYDKNNDSYKLIENQANAFASAFLLPAESLSYQLTFPTLDKLTAIKSKWLSSVAALIMRADSLGVIDSEDKTRLFKSYSARGWRKGEPLDDVTPPEKPQTLFESVQLLVNEGVLPKKSLSSTLNLNEDDIVRLCNLPQFFFREKSNIIKFKK